ncbi:MAG: PspC domain-containing protein [Bacteroidia bacterium]|nr:PspC domain-containing protein [Bacteroidia bacterium]
MKKTVTINISGIIFNIDEDAYEILQNYLNDITNRFSNAEEDKEIITDIEARIAELFNQKVNELKQVITIDDVAEMIAIMGNPQDFGGDDNARKEEASYAKHEKSEKNWRSKRIYRDPDNRVLGGVCSGLAAYFNIDPVFVRILMVITFFAFGPLLYIILWIAIPKARTTTQKLEMKGKKVNISNIEQNIREEFEEVKQNFKNMKDSRAYRESESFIEKLGHLFVVVLSSLLKIFVVFFGIILIIIGLGLLFGFLSSFIFGISDFSIGDGSITFSQMMNLFFESQDSTMFLICLILVIAIPIIAIIYGGVKLVFKIRTGNKIIGITVTALWLISAIYLLIFGLSEAKNFKVKDVKSQTYAFCDSTANILTLKASETDNSIDETDRHGHHKFEESNIKVVNGNPVITGSPKLTIVKSDTSCFLIIVKKYSRGKNQKQAKDNASEIKYEFKLPLKADSMRTTIFNSFFELSKDAKWRNPDVDIIVKVPVGKMVYIDKNMEPLLYDVENVSQTSDDEMLGKKWVMKKEGLTLAQ